MISQPRHNIFQKPDVIIDEAGQTWIRVDDPTPMGLWREPYKKIEEIRAKDCGSSRGTEYDPSGGRRKPSGRYSYRSSGSPSYFDESGEYYRDDNSDLSTAWIHNWVAKHFAEGDK